MILVKSFGATCSFAHLSWVTWANWSQSLICHERPERLAHSCSFDMSNLSYLLTVAHLIWAIWAIERISNEWMSEFPALPFSLVLRTPVFFKIYFPFFAFLDIFWLLVSNQRHKKPWTSVLLGLKGWWQPSG